MDAQNEQIKTSGLCGKDSDYFCKKKLVDANPRSDQRLRSEVLAATNQLLQFCQLDIFKKFFFSIYGGIDLGQSLPWPSISQPQWEQPTPP